MPAAKGSARTPLGPICPFLSGSAQLESKTGLSVVIFLKDDPRHIQMGGQSQQVGLIDLLNKIMVDILDTWKIVQFT